MRLTSIVSLVTSVVSLMETKSSESHKLTKNTKDPSQLIICSSLVAYKGLPYSQPYSMTKAALYNLASSLHIELKGIVDVKVITPGFVKTPLTDKNSFPMPLIISADSAASIIAKVFRDKLLLTYASLYPDMNLENHK